MRALLQEQTVDDEGLVTLMCDVESILTSRPITFVSGDPADQEPLTPNHLLLLECDSSMPPGVFQKEMCSPLGVDGAKFSMCLTSFGKVEGVPSIAAEFFIVSLLSFTPRLCLPF